MTDMNTNFGDLLSEYRSRSGLSKTDLARSIAVSLGYIINLEAKRKKPPTYDICDRIASLLRLTKIERSNFMGLAFSERLKPEDRKFIKELKGSLDVRG